MHPNMIRCIRLAIAIAAVLCVFAAPALAGDRPWEQTRWHALNAHYFPAGEAFSSDQSWLESQTHATESQGFEYSRRLNLNPDRRFILSIQGPLVWENAPGLSFEVRF